VGGYAPRAREDSMRPRRLGGAFGRPLNFTVRSHRPAMTYIIGIALIALGVLIIAYGDRQVGDNRRGGVITRIFSMPTLNAKVLKWVMGLLCVGFGLAALFTHGNR
jgi:hypothetical protein